MNKPQSSTEPAIAETADAARTVPPGPSPAGEPDRSSATVGGTPGADRGAPVREMEFVGGPMNGMRAVGVNPSAVAYSAVDATESGTYVVDRTASVPVAYWHVGAPQIAEPEQLRPTAPEDDEHVRPADTSEDEVRPARRPRSRRSGR